MTWDQLQLSGEELTCSVGVTSADNLRQSMQSNIGAQKSCCTHILFTQVYFKPTLIDKQGTSLKRNIIVPTFFAQAHKDYQTMCVDAGPHIIGTSELFADTFNGIPNFIVRYIKKYCCKFNFIHQVKIIQK